MPGTLLYRPRMPLTPLKPPTAASMRRYLVYASLIAVGAASALTVAWMTRDPHTATTERLAGTVTWSNAETRMFALNADGEPTDPSDSDTIYHVLGDWEDAEGTSYGSESFPTCLAGKVGDAVSIEPRRIELDAVRSSLGGPQKTNIAVFIRCLE
jgi:hypothetical protein